MENTYRWRGETSSRVEHDPRFEVVMLPAGRLACGQLVREPVLGKARITAITRAEPYVHLTWSDDCGPCTATGRYPMEQTFAVRVPHPIDRLKIERAVERASWATRPITGTAARLIAAHLNRGPSTALYRFSLNGAVRDAIFEELEQVAADQPAFRPWAHALAHYCLNREYRGPLTGWAPHAAIDQSTAAERLLPARRQRRRHTAVDIMAKKLMPTETARPLIDAAFAMGLRASQNELVAAKAKWIIRHYILGNP